MTTKFKKGDWVRALVDWIDTVAGDVMQVVTVRDNGVWMKDRLGDNTFINNSEVEPWTPKVGERVRMVRSVDEHKAECGATVVYNDGTVDQPFVIMFDEPHEWANSAGGRTQYDHGYWVSTADIEPLPVAAAAQPAAPEPLTIKAGCYYKTRAWRRVGPADTNPDNFNIGKDDCGRKAVAVIPDVGDVDAAGIWLCGDGKSDYGLIAEWPDDTTATMPPTNVAVTVDAINEEYGPVVKAKPKFKAGDRVKDKDYDAYAVVTSVDDERIDIVWDNGPRGRWPAHCFEPVTPAITTAIVCKLANGQPLPAIRPRAHISADDANAEAKRLASVNKGQEFGVFTLGETHKVEKTYEHEWQRLAICRKKIAAIKALKSMTGMGLKPAKDAVEYFLANAS